MFGSAVAIDGDYLVIGAYGETVNGAKGVGAAYTYDNGPDGYTFRREIMARFAHSGYEFGQSIALLPETVLIGSDMTSVEGKSNQGAACFFSQPPP